jgi:hypothetical protein
MGESTHTEVLRRELVEASRRLGAASGGLGATRRESTRELSHGASAQHRLGGRRLFALAGAILGLAAVIVAVAALESGGGSPPAAYALTQNPDGTVTLTLSEVLGVEPADDQLAKLGIPVVVAKIEPGCDETGELVRPTAPRYGEMIEPAKTGPGFGGLTWVIHPSLIPPGDSLRLSVQRDPDSSIPALGTGIALFRGQAPRCSRPAIFYP